MLVRRDDERVPAREVTVQRPDPDASARRDGLQSDALAFLGERRRRGGKQLVAVALGVGAERTGGHSHWTHLLALTKRRFLRLYFASKRRWLRFQYTRPGPLTATGCAQGANREEGSTANDRGESLVHHW